MNKQQSTTPLANYAKAMVTVRITLQQQFFQLQRTFQILIMIIGLLQNCVFLVRPTFKSDNLQVDHINVINYIMYISRIDLFIIDYLPGFSYQYYFLIPLILIIVFDILVLQTVALYFYHKRHSNIKSLKDQMQNNSLISCICLYGYAIYIQLFSMYLKVPLYMLLIEQINKSNEYNDNLFMILGIFTILALFIIDQTSNILFKESDSLKITGYEILNISITDFLIEVLILIQFVIYSSFEDPEQGSNAQGGLIIALSLFRIIQIVIQKKQPIRSFAYTVVITQSIALIYAICWLSSYTNLMVIIVIPLIYLICDQIIDSQNRIIEFQQITDHKEIKFHVAQFINNSINRKSPRAVLHRAIILNNHKLDCQDLGCNCRIEQHPTDDPTLMEFTSDKQMTHLILNKLSQINSDFRSRNKKLSQNSSDLLHYASTLYQLGYPILAFQYCMQILAAKNNQLTKIRIFEKHNEQKQIYSQSLNVDKSHNNSQSIDERLQSSSEKNLQKPDKLILNPSSISWLVSLKFEQLMHQIKSKLHISLALSSDVKKESVSYSMQLFLDNEQNNEVLRNFIIKVIQNKIEFYQFMAQAATHQSQMIFDKFKALGQMALELDRKVSKQYEAFPSIKYQSIICFFQAEVMNNLFEAARYATLTAMSEEKLMDTQSSINLFSKHVNYMILNLDQSLAQLQIQMHSNNLHVFFGYKYEFFKKQTNIDFLLPMAIIKEHGILIQKFIQTGKSKYFRNQNISFFRQSNQFIKPFKLLIDINYYQIENISFAAFIEPIETDSAYILVDVNNLVGGISQSLLDKIGFTKADIIQYGPEIIQMYRCQIETIIPDFASVKYNPEAKINLIKLSYLRDTSINTENQFKKQAPWWTKQSSFQIYNASIQLYTNSIYGIEYYILELNDIRQERQQIQQSAPLDFEIENLYLTDMDELGKSMSVNRSIANVVDIQVSEDEAIVRMPNKLQDDDGDCQIQLKADLMKQEIYSNLMSPNVSISKLIETAKHQAQQQFFNNHIEEVLNVSVSNGLARKDFDESNALEKHDPNIDDYIKIKIDQQLKQMNNNRDKQQLFDDLESTASTGIRKSVFFNKYDLITKTTNKIAMPESLIVTYVTIILFAIVSATYYIIVLTTNTSDMNKFIKEAQLLGVHSAFMAPLDNYQAMRVQIVQYQTMYRANIALLNVTIYANYTNWLSSRLQDGYNDMQDNFQIQFGNPYTTQFYIDNFIMARFQQTNQTVLQSKNITFQESLYVMLNYQFSFKSQYKKVDVNNYNQNQNNGSNRNNNRSSTNQYGGQSNQPYLIYAMANYFNFHNKFQDLSTEILAYSLNRKLNVESKWIWTWIPFIAVNVVIIFISYYCYRLYIKYYEQFIDLYKHLDNNSLQREVDKYKVMIGIMQKDSNILFRYHFDLEQKEAHILEQKTIKELGNVQGQIKKQKRYRSDSIAKLPFILSMLSFFSFIILFMVFSIIIQLYNSTYLSKYRNTAELYESLSDITYVLPGLYFQRNLANTISSYPYLGKSDLNDLYNRIAFGLQTISNFQDVVMNYDSNSYLSDDIFNTQFSTMNTDGVCGSLDEAYQQQVSIYCPLAFQGALQEGYYQSLSYIYHSLQNEQAINNFTNQTIYNLYEVEGAYTLMRATQSLQSNLYDSIQKRTNDSVTTSVEISVIYIVLMILMLGFLFWFVVGFYENEFFVIRRSILLLPTQTLFLDDIFERSLRFISLKDGN